MTCCHVSIKKKKKRKREKLGRPGRTLCKTKTKQWGCWHRTQGSKRWLSRVNPRSKSIFMKRKYSVPILGYLSRQIINLKWSVCRDNAWSRSPHWLIGMDQVCQRRRVAVLCFGSTAAYSALLWIVWEASNSFSPWLSVHCSIIARTVCQRLIVL